MVLYYRYLHYSWLSITWLVVLIKEDSCINCRLGLKKLKNLTLEDVYMITVFTSTYNRANTISRVFNSLMNQTYRDFEWIIVDDGSIDNTREIIEDFKKKSFFKIRYFYQKNAGKHIAINTGIIEARGEYFTNIDSDDEIKSESFEVLIDYWSKIPDNEKNNFKSVTARCYDPETKKGIGYEIPKEG